MDGVWIECLVPAISANQAHDSIFNYNKLIYSYIHSIKWYWEAKIWKFVVTNIILYKAACFSTTAIATTYNVNLLHSFVSIINRVTTASKHHQS